MKAAVAYLLDLIADIRETIGWILRGDDSG